MNSNWIEKYQKTPQQIVTPEKVEHGTASQSMFM